MNRIPLLIVILISLLGVISCAIEPPDNLATTLNRVEAKLDRIERHNTLIPYYNGYLSGHKKTGSYFKCKLIDGTVYKGSGVSEDAPDAIHLVFTWTDIFGYGKAPDNLIIGRQYNVGVSHIFIASGHKSDNITPYQLQAYFDYIEEAY